MPLRPHARSVDVGLPLVLTRAEVDELTAALKGALADGYAEAARRGLVRVR